MNKIIPIAAILFLAGAGCSWRESADGKRDADKASPMDGCSTAETPFACHLDKAMSANDPALCHEAGKEKWSNCLNAYEEIKQTEIDCNKLPDFEFKDACEKMKQLKADKGASTTN